MLERWVKKWWSDMCKMSWIRTIYSDESDGVKRKLIPEMGWVGDSYQEEQSVTFIEENLGDWAVLTADKEPVLQKLETEIKLCRCACNSYSGFIFDLSQHVIKLLAHIRSSDPTPAAFALTSTQNSQHHHCFNNTKLDSTVIVYVLIFQIVK